MMDRVYHQTTCLQGEALKNRIASCKSCKDAIRKLFENCPGKKFGASHVHALLLKTGQMWDINTVRGRMSDLKNEGFLDILSSELVPSKKEGGEAETPYTLNPKHGKR